MKRHIPNSITCCNLLCGCVAISMALSGKMEAALGFIILGAVFDFFDGLVARLLQVSSPIGKELDSLADVVTFGVAPSAMLFHFLQTQLNTTVYECQFVEGGTISLAWLSYLGFVMAAFSALRLAKFNLDERQTTSFIGLPTPANALFWASLLCAGYGSVTLCIPLMFVCCYLLVCELPMFALKFKQWGWKGNAVRYCFLLFSLVMIIALGIVDAWWLIIACYVITSACLFIAEKYSN